MANICIFGAGAFGTALALYSVRIGHSAPPVHELSKRMNVEMPISEGVYQVLHGGEDLSSAAFKLVNRERKDELAGIFDIK